RSLGEVNATAIQTRVLDGQMVMGQTASVSCAVESNGASGFSVNGHASLGAGNLNVSIPNIAKTATQASPASGSITYVSDATVQPYTGSGCNFYFLNASEGVDAGKAWLAFDCPSVTGSGGPSTCSITQSLVVLENCTTTGAL